MLKQQIKDRRNRIFIFLLLLTAGYPVYSQQSTEPTYATKERLFTQPSDPANFLGKTVLNLMQDKRGFIWVGTTDGLGRFDGREVTIFKNSPEDSTTLTNNYINALLETEDGKIWVATKRGLNSYDPRRDNFTRHFLNDDSAFVEKNYILSLEEDSQDGLWFGTYNGLFHLDGETGKLTTFEALSGKILEHVYALHLAADGTLWISNWDGLTVWDGEAATTYLFDEISPETTINYFSTLDQAANGKIWAATDQGFFSLEHKNGSLNAKHYLIDPNYSRGYDSNNIRHLFAEEDRLWITTLNNGLAEITLDEHEEVKAVEITPTQTNTRGGLRGTPANFTMKDASGNYWIATSSGIDQINAATGQFGQIKALFNNTAGLSGDIVTSLYFDSRENLWVGTITGLNFITKELLDARDFRFEKFTHDPAVANSISNDRIYTIEEDSFGRLWLGTRNGLNMLELEKFYATGQAHFNNYNTGDGLPSPSVFDVVEFRKGQLWLATSGKMARLRFDPAIDKKPVFLRYDMSDDRADALVNAFTYALRQDTAGNYWIATFLGLSKWSGDTEFEKNWQNLPHEEAIKVAADTDPREVGLFRNFRMDEQTPGSISDNSIVSLLSDPNGSLWVGTRNGLNRWTGEGFEYFGLEAGFENTLIQSMETDKQGRLWLGTNDGLVHFDPQLPREDAVLRTYRRADGITGNGFVFRASTKAPDGTLYFGTANGITYFKSAGLTTNQQAPQVALTGLKILNREISPGEAPLQSHVAFTERFKLNYRQNAFSLSFAALEFTRPTENTFRYKLDGFDEEWVNTSATSVNYTNLDPGRYTFQVQALNSDGIASEEMASVQISVLPAPWRSTLAYLLYALAALLATVLVLRSLNRRRQANLQQQLEIMQARMDEREQLRRKSAADFHDELGHRITKISLFAEMARQASQGSEQQQRPDLIEKIQQNTAELSDGVRDLIWSLDPSQDSLFETLSRLQDFGNRLFEHTEITFRMGAIPERLREMHLDADKRKHLLLIFKEAMNNCLKYSRATDAKMETTIEGNGLLINFQDNGVGLNAKTEGRQGEGRGLKNMQERASKIGATLKIESTEKSTHESGTRISLKMQLPQMG